MKGKSILGVISLENKHSFYISLGLCLFVIGLIFFLGFLWVYDIQTDKAIEGINQYVDMPVNSTERILAENLIQTRLNMLPGLYTWSFSMFVLFVCMGAFLVTLGLVSWKKPGYSVGIKK